jgi:hypothetical protein
MRTLHFKRMLSDESGQVIVWSVILIGLILGAAGLTVDLGHAYICYRQLQTSTDAAAMAGALAMIQPGATTTTVTTAATNLASTNGAANSTPNLPAPTIQVRFGCLATAAICSGGPGGLYNAVQVKQTSTVPTYFIKALALFGIRGAASLKLSAASTATMASGVNDQTNVAIVLDSTKSMQDTASNCGGKTKIKCALVGAQTMMSLLAPCTTDSITGTCVPYDRISLFTFPNIQAGTTGSDTDCSGSTSPTIMAYSAPTQGATWSTPTGTAATYQIADYSSNWASNNQVGGSFSGSSTLVNATGGPGSGCSGGGIQAIGGQNTYLAGAIYAAQSSLIAAQIAAPGSRNIMIVLSDGDANADPTNITGSAALSSKDTTPGHTPYRYGSANSECHQAIDAANYATTNGTTVYTVAYGSPNSGCSTDTTAKFSSPITPCSGLQLMSSDYASGDKSHFYSDGSCTSAYTISNLNGIFGSIAAQLTKSRLVPNPATPLSGT